MNACMYICAYYMFYVHMYIYIYMNYNELYMNKIEQINTPCTILQWPLKRSPLE